MAKIPGKLLLAAALVAVGVAGAYSLEGHRRQDRSGFARLLHCGVARPDEAFQGRSGNAARVLGLNEDETLLLQETPYRGSLPTAVPTDPLIYRF